MPRINRIEPSQNTIISQSPNALRRDAGAGADAIISLGQIGQEIGAQIEKASGLFERTRAQNQLESSIRDIEARAGNDLNVDVANQDKYFDEINDAIDRASQNITIPFERSLFHESAMGKVGVSQARIRNGFMKKKIDLGRAELDIYLKNKREDFIGSTNPKDKQTAIAERDYKIQEAVDSGYITPGNALTLRDEEQRKWNVAQVEYDISSDPQVAKDMLEDGSYDVGPEEKAKLLKLANQEIVRVQKEVEEDVVGSIIDGTATMSSVLALRETLGEKKTEKYLKKLDAAQKAEFRELNSDDFSNKEWKRIQNYIDVVEKMVDDRAEQFDLKSNLLDLVADGNLSREESKNIVNISKELKADPKKAFQWQGAFRTGRKFFGNYLMDQYFPTAFLKQLINVNPPEVVKESKQLLQMAYNNLYPEQPLKEDDDPMNPPYPKDIRHTPLLEKIGKGAGLGIAGVVDSLAGVASWFKQDSIEKALTNQADLMKDFYAIPDPDLISDISAGFASSATFMLPGIGIARGATLAASMPRLAAMIGLSTSTFLESVVQAGGDYQQSISKGFSEPQAAQNATKSFWLNVPTLALTNAMGGLFGFDKGGAVARWIKSSSGEGVQEFTQELISQALVKDIDLGGLAKSWFIGSIVGGGMGLTITASDSLGQLEATKVNMDKMKSERGSAVNPFNPNPEDVGPTPDNQGSVPENVSGQSSNLEGMKQIEDLRSKAMERSANLKYRGKERRAQFDEAKAQSKRRFNDWVEQADLYDPQVREKAISKFPVSDAIKGRLLEHFKQQDASTQGVPSQESEVPQVPTFDELISDKTPLNTKIDEIVRQAQGKETETIGVIEAAQQELNIMREELNAIPEEQLTDEQLVQKLRIGEASQVYNESLKQLKGAQSVTQQVNKEKALKEAESINKSEPGRSVKTAINKNVKMATTPEAKIMKYGLQKEQKGSRSGYSQGRKETIAKLKNLYEGKIKDISRSGELKLLKEDIKSRDIQKGDARAHDVVKNYVLDNVPLKERGKYIKAIDNAKTFGDVIGVFRRVDKHVEALHKTDLVNGIKKVVKGVKKSKNVAIDYVSKINDVVGEVDLTKRTAKTVEKLNKLQDFIDQAYAAGENVSLPRRINNNLLNIFKKPIDAVNVAELENVYEDIQSLREIGETKLKSRRAIDDLLKEKDIKALKEGSSPIKSEVEPRSLPGETKTTKDTVSKNYRQSRNRAMLFGLDISPMDVVFDNLDSNVGYSGPNYRIFKKRIDAGFNAYLEMKDSFQQSVVDLAQSLGLGRADFELIGIHAAREQEGGIEKLINSGFTAEQINSVRLNDKQMQLYLEMRKKLDEMRPSIEETMRKVYNQPLGRVRNYFSFMTDFEAMSKQEVRNAFGDKVEQFGQAPRKNVAQGFTVERNLGAQKIKIDAMDIFMKHTDNASYLVSLGGDIKYLQEIAKSNDYAEAVGDVGQGVVVDWLDLMARKGSSGEARIPILDRIRINVGAATIGAKLSSVLIQPTALMDGAGLIGKDAFVGFKDIIVSKDMRQFVLNNFPEVKARVADDPSFLEFDKFDPLAKLQKAGYTPLRQLDALTASGVALGAYRKSLSERGLSFDPSKVDKTAVEYAQLVVRRTQASGFFKDTPTIFNRGESLTGNISLNKAILQFQSFLFNRWSFIQHDMASLGFASGDIKKGLNIAFFLAMANFAEIGLRHISKDFIDFIVDGDIEDDDETDFTKEFAVNAVQNVPFAGQAVSLLEYSSLPVPSLNALSRLTDAIDRFKKSKKPATKTKNALRLLTNITGVLGLPGSQQADQIIRESADNKKKKRLRVR